VESGKKRGKKKNVARQRGNRLERARICQGRNPQNQVKKEKGSPTRGKQKTQVKGQKTKSGRGHTPSETAEMGKHTKKVDRQKRWEGNKKEHMEVWGGTTTHNPKKMNGRGDPYQQRNLVHGGFVFLGWGQKRSLKKKNKKKKGVWGCGGGGGGWGGGLGGNGQRKVLKNPGFRAR